MKIMYVLALACLLVGATVASAQTPDSVGTTVASAQTLDIAGTWVLAAADKLLPDGTRVEDYGPNPHGLVVFTADGYYSLQIYRAERRKFASGDKFSGTPEEYKDVSLGMSVSFGRYSFDPVKRMLTFRIDRSSVPNSDGRTTVRAVELTGDTISWKVDARKDGSIPITVLRRAK